MRFTQEKVDADKEKFIKELEHHGYSNIHEHEKGVLYRRNMGNESTFVQFFVYHTGDVQCSVNYLEGNTEYSSITMNMYEHDYWMWIRQLRGDAHYSERYDKLREILDRLL